MKKILFVLSVLTMAIVVGCSNPTNPVIIPPVVPTTEPETPATVEPEAPVTPAQPETPSQPETPATTEPEQPTEPQTPAAPEDKSPYEYVLPNGVDYSDYTYVGDYVFSDMYDFASCVWFNGTANSEYGYFMVLEKIARVRYNGNGTPYALYDWDNDTYPLMEKGTSYKVYLKPEYIQARKNENKLVVFSSYGTTRDKNPDCNTFCVRANNYNYDILTLSGEINASDYVAY